ncbi:hypothetical protein F0562_020611 [Nyssa sinensis]|uniref:Uncharacterized protein n=1 Tax=Nyssa sinensis TaxID=561372 RepID=A0A5J5BSZ8_9ASTE|nr:hypothetical protein F0562_020611 [Nyssa sinensis]
MVRSKRSQYKWHTLVLETNTSSLTCRVFACRPQLPSQAIYRQLIKAFEALGFYYGQWDWRRNWFLSMEGAKQVQTQDLSQYLELIFPIARQGRDLKQRLHQLQTLSIKMGLDSWEETLPMETGRGGNLTWSSAVGGLIQSLNLQVHGFHDATVYGATTGFPYRFYSSFHGGHAHGFHHHSNRGQWRNSILQIWFLFVGLVVIFALISV